MPLIPIAVALLFICALILAMPLLLVQRYRIGTARRLGRGWVATLNLVILSLSAGLFLCAVAVTNFWVPEALKYSVAGFAGGVILGLLGLALTHWEVTSKSLHYTPNRWLILIITVAVALRLAYGLWRGWHAWSVTGRDASWLAASGAAESLAVGAVVLGYYFSYSVGVRRRLGRHRKQSG